MAGLLNESPFSPAHRPLKDEPLTAEDWRAVWVAYRAFITQVRMIVQQARDRREAQHGGHFREECSCGKVIRTCRCMGDKTVTVLPHPACEQDKPDPL